MPNRSAMDASRMGPPRDPRKVSLLEKVRGTSRGSRNSREDGRTSASTQDTDSFKAGSFKAPFTGEIVTSPPPSAMPTVLPSASPSALPSTSPSPPPSVPPSIPLSSVPAAPPLQAAFAPSRTSVNAMMMDRPMSALKGFGPLEA